MTNFVNVPLREPTFVSPTYERPDATTVSIIRYRGAWSAGQVYNTGDFVTFIGDGTYQLIVCVVDHASTENFDVTFWALIVDFLTLGADLPENLVGRVSLLETSLAEGNIDTISGNRTEIRIKNFLEEELLGFSSTVPVIGEFWFQTDGIRKLSIGDGATAFADLQNLIEFSVTTDLEELLADAQIAANQAEAAKQFAKDWASAPAGQQIEGTLESARAYAQRAGQLLRVLAAYPTRQVTGSAYTIQKSLTDEGLGDEMRQLLCTGAGALDITLIEDFHTAKAKDGSDGMLPFKVWNQRTGGAIVTFVGVGGSTPLSVQRTGIWSGSRRNTGVVPGTITSPLVVAVSVPAGAKRKLWINTFEINASTNAHEVSAVIDVGTLAVSVPATGPTGSATSAPRVNAKAFSVTLADSVTPTSHNITFSFPNGMWIFGYRIRAYNNVEAFSDPAGRTTNAGFFEVAETVTAQANSVVLLDFGVPGTVTPVTSLEELTTTDTVITTGVEIQRDLTMFGGEIAAAPTGDRTLTATISTDNPPNAKSYAVIGVSIDPATTGGTGIAVVGTPLTIASGKSCVVEAFSDGRTYYLTHGA